MAYLPDWGRGLAIIDVADPDSPSLISSYDTPDIATRLCVSGRLAYVADSASGIQIIDVFDPEVPKWVGSYNTTVSAEGVFVSGDKAYVADWTGGVLILDVSNPASPKRLGSCATGPSAANLVVSGSLAYVACWESGLKVIDVSNPAAPKIVASYDTPGRAVRVAVSGEVVYLTDSTGGFHIFRVRMVDLTAPVITLLGDNPVTLEVGTPYVEPGYTATDGVDGDISANVVVTGSVDHTVLGIYVLSYNVSDSAGNRAQQKLRTIMVVDTTPPGITLLGDNPMTLELGTPYIEPRYVATDNYDGDITANVVVTGSVDHNIVGTYTLYYDVSDSSGNPAQQVTRVVEVVETAPFEVVEVGQAAGGTFRLTWNSVPGGAYMIWSCDDLAAGIWKSETPEPIPSAGEITTWTDPDTTARQKFYRIELK
jgi:hypothetical protein